MGQARRRGEKKVRREPRRTRRKSRAGNPLGTRWLVFTAKAKRAKERGATADTAEELYYEKPLLY
jgi:hypothetical protein